MVNKKKKKTIRNGTKKFNEELYTFSVMILCIFCICVCVRLKLVCTYIATYILYV